MELFEVRHVTEEIIPMGPRMKILFGEKTESISTKLHLNWMPRMNNRVTNNVETERVMLFSTASPLRLSVEFTT